MELIGNCNLIELPLSSDHRGCLSFVEGQKHIPFHIQRVFFLYDIPEGNQRGGHALKTCQQFIIPISGSFDVILKDDRSVQHIHLSEPHRGLYLPPVVWRELEGFSIGAVCLVLASDPYDANAYYRDFDSYLAAIRFAHGG